MKYHPSSNTLISTEQRGGVLIGERAKGADTIKGVQIRADEVRIYINTIADFLSHRKCIA